jgi:4-amino-4-deoxy-L-arabinose transferase-like glycosyltransferase
MLPQVIEGVVSVLVLYRVVRRWTGPATGLAAAGIFAITPIAAAMFGHSLTADPALTMCLILAADAWQHAADSARLRPLLLAGLWVGLGFQAKMLQAWAVQTRALCGTVSSSFLSRVGELSVTVGAPFALEVRRARCSVMHPFGGG